MNTYFNEITSKPINTVDGKILYKIPAGALCGNGDLGVVFDNNETDLIIHISKCDFWKFTPGAHKDGGIKTVGNIIIENVDLANYNIKQYFDEGLLNCKFGNSELEFFVAPENVIYFEIKVPDSCELPVTKFELPDTCGSINSEFCENGVSCYSRKFTGENLERDSAVSVSLKAIDKTEADGFKTVRYAVSVVSNFDSENHIGKSVEMVSNCDYSGDKAKTREKYQKLFNSSKVTLEDKEIESFYNSSLYHLANCMGNTKFPPGLFGNFITDDFFPWAGDYHMNYNFEAPYYCIFSSNHPELFDGYMVPLHDMSEMQKNLQSFLVARAICCQ